MATLDLSALVAPVRSHGHELLSACEDPHAELLAMVWGPRFDREHARGLMALDTRQGVHLLRTIDQAAVRFDGLAEAQKKRVRQLIVRHHRRWDNAACTAFC